MISGNCNTRMIPVWLRPVLLTLALLAPVTTWPAAPEADAQIDALIKRLARPAPASIAFTEVRLSPLLRQPLIVSGELGYSGPASLDRHVTQPYREYTAIRGESVRVEREGEPVRSFALKRAPELRGLLNGFSALLIGDVASLRRSFNISSYTATGNDWAITMTPLDTKVGRRVKQLGATGRDNEPRCFTLTTADGGSSVMLLGEAAQQAIPAAATATQLDTLCMQESAP